VTVLRVKFKMLSHSRLKLTPRDSQFNALIQYGQGGNCAEHFPFTYHNSFLIADCQSAWVLETAGKYWVAERITCGTRSLSNNLTIRGKGDLQHPDVIGNAIAKRLCTSEADFDFAQMFSEGGVEDSVPPYSREGRVRSALAFGNAKGERSSASLSLCQLHQGKFAIDTPNHFARCIRAYLYA
jgi:secernin